MSMAAMGYVDRMMQQLALPCWEWGRFYERVVKNYMTGSLSASRPERGVNYFWGMNSGVIDVHLSENLPSGVRSLAEILKRGVVSGDIKPFNTHIVDQNGIVRCDGEHWLSAEEIMGMDWLCDNVEGSFPELNELRPESVELAKLLGIKREGASNEDLAAGR